MAETIMVATTTIALDRDAYELLRKRKRQGESFSDVVKRELLPFLPLSDLAGAWKDIPADEWRQMTDFWRESRALGKVKHDALLRKMLGDVPPSRRKERK